MDCSAYDRRQRRIALGGRLDRFGLARELGEGIADARGRRGIGGEAEFGGGLPGRVEARPVEFIVETRFPDAETGVTYPDQRADPYDRCCGLLENRHPVAPDFSGSMHACGETEVYGKRSL